MADSVLLRRDTWIRLHEAEQENVNLRRYLCRGADGPPLTIFECTIPTEGAPSLRFLQGWAAMLRALFDFVVDT
jgi:hypothetical protein